MRILFNDEQKIFYPEEVRGLFNDLEKEVNLFSFDAKSKTDNLDTYERCLWMHIALEWIHYHTSHLVFEDLRNQLAMEKIRYLSKLPSYQRMYSFYFIGDDEPGFEKVAVEFCKCSNGLHRTLMQSMSSFFFCVLDKTCPDIHSDMIEECDSWWMLPLI